MSVAGEQGAIRSPPPTSIGNQYIIHDDVVGRGAWSVVKRCSPISPYVPAVVKASPLLKDKQDIKFVVKIIEKDYLISLTKGDVERAMAEVKREIEVLKHIPPHKHVVNFIEHFETEKHFLLIFEEVQCGDLCELILQTPDAKLDEQRAKKYTYQLIQSVLHCHVHDVIHRDIKPENLLVNSNDDIKLTDFGLAKWMRTSAASPPSASAGNISSMSSTDVARLSCSFPGAERLHGKRIICSDVIGTPRYGAPEMFYAKFSQTQYDGYKADTWSVGVVVYIILSGTFPFFSGSGCTEQETFKAIIDTPLAIPKHISLQAADFLQRLLSKDPQKRIHLWDALDHPWLESVASTPIRRSEVAAKLRASAITDPEQIISACEDEVIQLHSVIAKLRRDLLAAKWREQEFTSMGGSKTSAATGGSIRRPETPPPGGRPRTATSASPMPAPAARLLSPGRLASSTIRSTAATTSAQRTGSPSRVAREDVGVSRGASTSTNTKPSTVPSARTASPLARSSASTQRRGTPLRATGVNAPSTAANGPLTAKRSTTPTATGRPSSSTIQRSPAPPGTPTTTSAAAAAGKEFAVGESVLYKNFRGIVQFSGTTTFGPGVWIGLEMLEGNDGTNDGTSFVDKKRYFTCPKGRGVFVRASQIKKAENGIVGGKTDEL